MRESLTECLGKKENTSVTGSSRHNTGFVGDLFEFYKPVYTVCYPSIFLLHHMVFPRISQHQAGRQEKTRALVPHVMGASLRRKALITIVHFNDYEPSGKP